MKLRTLAIIAASSLLAVSLAHAAPAKTPELQASQAPNETVAPADTMGDDMTTVASKENIGSAESSSLPANAAPEALAPDMATTDDDY
ncbi:hypothetical protein AYO45_02550 [Gammaproteobacteria bacterium SCGC AG-212-F23]|nr:hypothetical protein AYO45_02550 [Gammaproteobacteria bacterium SCGC AG-212-F23]